MIDGKLRSRALTGAALLTLIVALLAASACRRAPRWIKLSRVVWSHSPDCRGTLHVIVASKSDLEEMFDLRYRGVEVHTWSKEVDLAIPDTAIEGDRLEITVGELGKTRPAVLEVAVPPRPAGLVPVQRSVDSADWSGKIAITYQNATLRPAAPTPISARIDDQGRALIPLRVCGVPGAIRFADGAALDRGGGVVELALPVRDLEIPTWRYDRSVSRRFGGSVAGTVQIVGRVLDEELPRKPRPWMAPYRPDQRNPTMMLAYFALNEYFGNPKTLAEIALIATAEYEWVEAGRCGPYIVYEFGRSEPVSRSRFATRKDWRGAVTLREARTRRAVATRTFHNSMGCPTVTKSFVVDADAPRASIEQWIKTASNLR
jgi:hypothetical protein